MISSWGSDALKLRVASRNGFKQSRRIYRLVLDGRSVSLASQWAIMRPRNLTPVRGEETFRVSQVGGDENIAAAIIHHRRIRWINRNQS